MEILLTPEQDDLIRLGIEQGQYRDYADAVHSAMNQWVERQRARLELLAALDAGENSFGEEDVILDSDEAISTWIGEVKQRGRAKLASV